MTVNLPTVINGDCFDVLRTLPDASVDAVITDPPYNLSFMGRNWDTFAGKTEPGKQGGTADKGILPGYGRGGTTESRVKFRQNSNLAFQIWCQEWAIECFRILKPGGHMLVFGSTRTFHRLTCGIEDAGFEIRDTISYIYGSGFPKSLDISKAIDKAAGVQRKKVTRSRVDGKPTGQTVTGFNHTGELNPNFTLGEPITDEATQWKGWGTALKPSYEPVVVARKPFPGPVVTNVLKHGTGGLNIDATRIGTGTESQGTRSGEPSSDSRYTKKGAVNLAVTPGPRGGSPDGRWPANTILVHDENCLLVGERQVRTGVAVNRNRSGIKPNSVYGTYNESYAEDTGYAEADGKETIEAWDCVPDCPVNLLDSQSGSRRSAGQYPSGAQTDSPLFGERIQGPLYNDKGGASRFFYTSKAGKKERPVLIKPDGETIMHPTVKPLSVMRWLVRLVTPPAGVVLDPFAGSGATLEAAWLEGFDSVGIEREPDYVELITIRLKKHQS